MLNCAFFEYFLEYVVSKPIFHEFFGILDQDVKDGIFTLDVVWIEDILHRSWTILILSPLCCDMHVTQQFLLRCHGLKWRLLVVLEVSSLRAIVVRKQSWVTTHSKLDKEDTSWNLFGD